MTNSNIPGYAGKLLRVDLSKHTVSSEPLTSSFLRMYPGGACMGVKFIYDEVPKGVNWNDPQNRLFLGSGLLGGTRVGGSGSICVVTKGALTEGMTSTQANGFFGTFLKMSGFDAIILEGASPDWCYLHIQGDGKVEIKDARHLLGKDTFETEDVIKQELGKTQKQMSVACIGVAGENLVRFSLISVDKGHMASHNGVGAVMGSKKVKAIAVDRGNSVIPVVDKDKLAITAETLRERAMADKFNRNTLIDGTGGGVPVASTIGFLPVKNYSTSVNFMSPETLETYKSAYMRERFKAKRNTCWACASNHCHTFELPGMVEADEPEYEGMSACSSIIGLDKVDDSILLTNTIDRLGIDINETGYLMGCTIESFEKGIITTRDTDGLEMTWGNGPAILKMLHKIARREGFGNVLAEGTMRAARKMGPEAQKLAVHSMKGNTPRGHDHRSGMWFELFETCVSSMGSIEAYHAAPFKVLGIPFPYDTFDPIVVSGIVAKVKGAMLFEDSMVVCRFQACTQIDLLAEAANAVTGFDIDAWEAMKIGKRAANLGRLFNLRHGISSKLDRPSPRYGSTPVDGSAKGVGIMPRFDEMLQNYYREMGWDENGIPLPATLKDLGVEPPANIGDLHLI